MCEAVLLYPRPLARYPGRLLLLPLLPHRPSLKPLPSEIWSRIFVQALFEDDQNTQSHNAHNNIRRSCLSLMLVCKGFKEVAMPLLYSNVCLHSVNSLQKFTAHLHSADRMWDSIRRIPYSTPGRWVQVLDLSALLAELDSSAYYAVNALLTQLFPLLPFLAKLTLYSGFLLSCRALASLTHRDGSSNIRALGGIYYDPFIYSAVATGEDHFVQLLRVCVNLELLEVTGIGLDDTDLESHFDDAESLKTPDITVPLYLPHLRSLTLLSMPSSLLMYVLLHSPLPRLRTLSLTPYDDIPFPASLSSVFLETHGQPLRNIFLFTPMSWPTRYHSSPSTILNTSPHLRHLSLEYPLPALTLTFQRPLTGVSSPCIIPLQILSIPRPSSDFWVTLERLLPFLPSLQTIRMRDVQWLRHGMTSRAQEAGIQGEMMEWDRRLTRRGIRLLDRNWKESQVRECGILKLSELAVF
ncbi:uncharacterized protein F5891DRAFT_1124180 [Suillus fuscotomentosus]|uniref:F-box domain-containing protein n=1 Tax=Suillus fuscotomentosus TaxID=1912939 RepID=A0AAD4HSE3_9AGAM|nr:uncharacterized protein F5891DRAFT_1124180 [Suillus fuscotomentosus]KAG1908355.1 hypothetical protein F5891DRAFT_1124180 [Suillus fuscotomentosus]